MSFLAALFLAVAALTSRALAQLDTTVQRTEAFGCRLGKRTGEARTPLSAGRMMHGRRLTESLLFSPHVTCYAPVGWRGARVA